MYRKLSFSSIKVNLRVTNESEAKDKSLFF